MPYVDMHYEFMTLSAQAGHAGFLNEFGILRVPAGTLCCVRYQLTVSPMPYVGGLKPQYCI